jgi:hypothetical protein
MSCRRWRSLPSHAPEVAQYPLKFRDGNHRRRHRVHIADPGVLICFFGTGSWSEGSFSIGL